MTKIIQDDDERFSTFLKEKGFVVIRMIPVPKPRMTLGDRYQKRPRGHKYRMFKSELGATVVVDNIEIPLPYLLVMVLPMPKSWSNKKKVLHRYQPHLPRPDKDNLEKAFLDALYDDDSEIYDGRVVKLWGDKGLIAFKPIESLWVDDRFLGFPDQQK